MKTKRLKKQGDVIKTTELDSRVLHVVVSGDSMSPLYNDGDELEFFKFECDKTNIEVGDVILFEHPYKEHYLMIKRLNSIDEDGRFVLHGDNKAHSTDSRSFGSISQSLVLGILKP